MTHPLPVVLVVAQRGVERSRKLVWCCCLFSSVFFSSECHALCHPKCSPCLPATCGMSSDCSLHLSEGLCRDKGSSAGQQLKEASGHMHLEGWMKQPRLATEKLTQRVSLLNRLSHPFCANESYRWGAEHALGS